MTEVMIFHPKMLVLALENAVLFTTDKAGLEVSDVVMVANEDGRLAFTGRGRYSASVQRLTPAKECHGMSNWDIIISVHAATDAVAVLKSVDGYGRRDCAVEVMPIEGGLVVSDGAEAIVTLMESEEDSALRGDDEFQGIFEVVERARGLESKPLGTTPLVFSRGVLKKLDKVKLGSPLHEADRWAAGWLGGATFKYTMTDDGTDFTAYLEACRDGFEGD